MSQDTATQNGEIYSDSWPRRMSVGDQQQISWKGRQGTDQKDFIVSYMPVI